MTDIACRHVTRSPHLVTRQHRQISASLWWMRPSRTRSLVILILSNISTYLKLDHCSPWSLNLKCCSSGGDNIHNCQSPILGSHWIIVQILTCMSRRRYRGDGWLSCYECWECCCWVVWCWVVCCSPCVVSADWWEGRGGQEVKGNNVRSGTQWSHSSQGPPPAHPDQAQ